MILRQRWGALRATFGRECPSRPLSFGNMVSDEKTPRECVRGAAANTVGRLLSHGV